MSLFNAASRFVEGFQLWALCRVTPKDDPMRLIHESLTRIERDVPSNGAQGSSISNAIKTLTQLRDGIATRVGASHIREQFDAQIGLLATMRDEFKAESVHAATTMLRLGLIDEKRVAAWIETGAHTYPPIQEAIREGYPDLTTGEGSGEGGT